VIAGVHPAASRTHLVAVDAARVTVQYPGGDNILAPEFHRSSINTAGFAVASLWRSWRMVVRAAYPEAERLPARADGS
jgi:hypothetical protein